MYTPMTEEELEKRDKDWFDRVADRLKQQYGFIFSPLTSGMAGSPGHSNIARSSTSAVKDYLADVRRAFDEGYRQGVLDATIPTYGNSNPDEVNGFLNYRRKALLTEKVTRYINIYRNNADEVYPSICLWHSEDGARQDPSPNLVGTYPLEIELPL